MCKKELWGQNENVSIKRAYLRDYRRHKKTSARSLTNVSKMERRAANDNLTKQTNFISATADLICARGRFARRIGFSVCYRHLCQHETHVSSRYFYLVANRQRS